MGALALNREASATSAEVMLGRGPLERSSTDQALQKGCRLFHYIVSESLVGSRYSLVPRPLSSGGGMEEKPGDEAKAGIDCFSPSSSGKRNSLV